MKKYRKAAFGLLAALVIAASILLIRNPFKEEQETSAMTTNETVQQLAQAVGCPQRTAQSILDILTQKGIVEITGIEVRKKTEWYSILDITAGDSAVYTVHVGPGYGVSKILHDGKVIYRVFQ